MCYAYDAAPPPPPGAGETRAGQQVTLTAEDGTALLAWHAEAAAPTGAAAVILPDIRGLFPFYQRLAEQFAALGIDAVAIDYFGRTAGTGPRDEEFDHRAHVARTSFEGVHADIDAGMAHLRTSAGPRAIFTVGFCFGGSYSFTLAARGGPDLAGVIGFYGGLWPRSEGAPSALSEAPRARVPVLGLFGGADQSIPADQVEEFRAGLERAGVPHQIHVYPGAPHSFFDRTYTAHAAACADAWQRVREFIIANTPAG